MSDDWQCPKCSGMLPDSPDLALAIRVHEKSHEPRSPGSTSKRSGEDLPGRISDSVDAIVDAIVDVLTSWKD